MDSVSLNGRRLSRAVVVPVNPALDRDAVKAYLDIRKDGLDSIGIEVNGQQMVVVGRDLPKLGKGDRLELGSKAAQMLYQENETNSFSEGLVETARSNKGAAYLLGGFAAGGVGAYLATLAGFLVLPIGISMIAGAVTFGLLAVGVRAAIGGWFAKDNKVDLSVTERMSDPSFRQVSSIEKQTMIGNASVKGIAATA